MFAQQESGGHAGEFADEAKKMERGKPSPGLPMAPCCGTDAEHARRALLGEAVGVAPADQVCTEGEGRGAHVCGGASHRDSRGGSGDFPVH